MHFFVVQMENIETTCK